MACALTSGFTPKACKSVGGVKSFLIIEHAAVTAVTKTAGVVTAITKTSPFIFREYKQKSEVAMYKETATVDGKAGTYAFDIEATLEQSSLDQATASENFLLLKNTVMIVTKDNDGTFWLLGEDNGLDVVTVGSESGTAYGDFKGNKISFKGRAYTPMATVDPTIITGLTS
jgi:hypothetical protein